MSSEPETLGGELPLVAHRPPGPRSRALMAELDRRDCPAFTTRRRARAAKSGDDFAPIVLARGEGANVWDADDNRYVDLAAGFGSVLLGHGAPASTRAIEAQSTKLVQGLGDLYASDVKIALVERLARLHPASDARVLLCQSGADAITAALKTAMLATGKPGVLAFHGAYHGLSYAPLAACGFKETYRAPFAEQLNTHVELLDYPRKEADVEGTMARVETALARGNVGCVLVEPILGRGGVVVPPAGFLERLAERARAQGALVVADEIWTGLGRSGATLRMVECGAAFDILCLGKGLGGSLSLSACIASDDTMSAWARGGEVVHTSTHAGAPLACATALATLDEIERRGLVSRSRDVGERFLASLRARLAGAEEVVDVRGAGLMIGVELADGHRGLRAMRALLERGFLVTSGGRDGEVVVLTPPLVIAERQLEALESAMVDLFTRAA